MSSDPGWTLFLDRDGVINQRIVGGYVTHSSDFVLLPGITEAIPMLNRFFRYTMVVTNQQGIGKGIMSEKQLDEVHRFMLMEIEKDGGRIDHVYFCPHLESVSPPCRKPRPGMALLARKEFPDIDFRRSVMAGDTKNDLLFGKRLGMVTVLIAPPSEARKMADLVDYRFDSLFDFAMAIQI